MKKPLIVANWKMNILSGDNHLHQTYVRKILRHRHKDMEIVIFPPATHIGTLQAISCDKIAVGAQDISPLKAGAYTGDISALCVLAVGATYVLVGHSERRIHHGETDATVCAKVVTAVSAGLRSIVCIGETDRQKKTKITREVLAHQLDASIPKDCLPDSLVVAYEPVWAIGTGHNPDVESIVDIHTYIRSHLLNTRGKNFTVPILYGGSVTADNAREILDASAVDGLLVGGASLKWQTFVKILDVV